ncbi:DEAD/DEAH box helicase family protein [Hydrogenimonas sp.]
MARFNEKLVLNRWMLSHFDAQSIEDFDYLKDKRLETIDENGQSRFYQTLGARLFDNPRLPKAKLEEYDANIVRHTEVLGRDIRWKYFQYLSLLFVEIYLDRFFNDKERLLAELNTFLDEFNETLPPKERIEPFKEKDLNKLAFWSATGSGKTLLMHINFLQFQHYAKGKIKINKTLLLTPNEGLSAQHEQEFKRSNIYAETFKKEAQSSPVLGGVEIIEITKLADEEGDKTVAVESFEDNNLVFIDEGHRGSSGDKWKNNRDKLSVNGFAFEYSATFGQAINAAATKDRKKLTQEYAKAILFDYSYKYFYNDGYGKDYAIFNIDGEEEETRFDYLVAGVLSFYQQARIYADKPALMKTYNIEKPLMVFVGSSVNAVRTENRRKVSDVIDILLFFDRFIANEGNRSLQAIERILSGESGMVNKKNEDIFINRFAYLSSLEWDAKRIFDDLRTLLFGNSHGTLHLDNLKGVGGEIGLRLGEGEYFGVINVGDTNDLEKLCIENGLDIAKKEFSDSLFANINQKESPINLLIGAKKFTEGWSSWRVSTMGLMNVGKKEGSQIIQLFGRGVRLKGKDFSLKRSRAYDQGIEARLQSVETLGIFGIKADYMRQFKAYLEEEGVPTGERVEFILPVIRDTRYKKHRLKVLRLKKEKSFKKEIFLSLNYKNEKRIFKKVVLNLYKQVEQMERSNVKAQKIHFEEAKLTDEHIAFLNTDRIFFEIERYKSERNWSNLSISKEAIESLLRHHDWYALQIPSAQLEINSFDDINRIKEIVIALLKLYTKAFYEHEKAEWESRFMEYAELDENDANFIDSYCVSVDDKETDIIQKLRTLEQLLIKKDLNEAKFKNIARSDFRAIVFDKHLYNPLLYKDRGLLTLSITPVELNDSEATFVEDLKRFVLAEPDYLKNTQLFLLRNRSKIGVGFFEAGNFYPDFIMWLIRDSKQYIVFIDPKGLRNVDVLGGGKVNFFKEIKELEKKLGEEDTILESFIVSTTSFNALSDIQSALSKEDLEKKHVLFQKDDKEIYVKKIFKTIFDN